MVMRTFSLIRAEYGIPFFARVGHVRANQYAHIYLCGRAAAASGRRAHRMHCESARAIGVYIVRSCFAARPFIVAATQKENKIK